MIIGIDGNEANTGVRVGIGEYAFELIREFSKSAGPARSFQIYLKTSPLPDMPKSTPFWQYNIVKPRKLWTQIGLPIYLYSHFPRPSIFFTPSHYAPRFSPASTVISIMDLAYLRFPELFDSKDLYQLKNWTTYSVKNAKKVFTISNSSKNDIIKYYQVEPEKIVVTHLGIKPELKNETAMDKLENKYNISKNYVLFVGTLQPRKNISRLIEAFSLVVKNKDDSNLQLVIVGKKGWKFEDILEAPKKFNIEDKVRFLDFVTDEDLAGLYAKAMCFVLPSLYEGFGLPVLEAMKYGCPVITSNVSSLPEVGGDAVLYIDPEDTKDIAQKIEELLSNSKLREELTKKGKEQVKKFSWEKTAKQTLEVLEGLVNN